MLRAAIAEQLGQPAVAEPLLQAASSPEALWQKLLTLTADPSARVRFQLALTLGQVSHPGQAQALASIAHFSAAADPLRAIAHYII